MIKIITATLTFLFAALIWVFPSTSYALAKFSTSYQISYLVQENGQTHVNYVINQKNNLSVVYATEYSISLNETRLENIKVKDEGIYLIPEVIKTLNQTSISFPFVNKIVGKDKNHTFTIEYDTSDIATKHGNTWQIDIPRLEPDENISEQSVIITVPPGFPSPAYIDPQPDLVNSNIYYFSGKKISHKPISAIFGQTQYYQGKILYHLGGDNLTKVISEIALPPNTSYQTVYYQDLTPPPDSVYTDEDDNFIARYSTTPREELEVTLNFTVKLDFNPRPTLTQPSDKYLLAQPIWNFDHSVFSSVELKNLTSPQSIYDYVVDKMQYDYSKINRQKPARTPAAVSLTNYQSAICTDFTDVFVALARKAGIPARELQGFAISENPDLKPLSLTQDVLHAWPEYFNRESATWIQVDPTWANTTRGIDYFHKLDFNHIVLAIHGTDAEHPIPAGGYRNGSNSKSIFIEPADALSFPDPILTVQFVDQEESDLIFQINNSSGVAFSGQAKVAGNEYLQETAQTLKIAPFGQATFRIRSQKLPFVRKDHLKVIIYLNGKPYETAVVLGSTTTPLTILTGIGGILVLIAVGTWGVHLRRQKRKTSLYR